MPSAPTRYARVAPEACTPSATWTPINTGIAESDFSRAIREDPEKKGLLYAGTEHGVWVSWDDGAHWQSMGLNLPLVPVHDLTIKDGDLIIATHGRSFYVFDDLSPIRQMTPASIAKDANLYKPRDAYRVEWGGGRGGRGGGGAAPSGAVVYYTLAKGGQDVSLEFLDAQGKVIKAYSSKPDSSAAPTPAAPADEDGPRPPAPVPVVPNKAGLNTFSWNLRYPDAVTFPGMILWAGDTRGPVAPAGT